MKRIALILFVLGVTILLIPTLLVLLSQDSQPLPAQALAKETSVSEKEASLIVPVFRTQLNKVEQIALEDYVVGVVASEMPATFELEALKAQALTARTYIIKQMLDPGEISLPEDAIVTDSVMHQVFQNKEELQRKWGRKYEQQIAPIIKAVYETKGQVLTFEGMPITAAFFSTSNGYTENSEDYWQNEIPYLRSVTSKWDSISPQFTNRHLLSVSEFERLLEVKLPKDGKTIGKIIERTGGNRVAKVQLGNKQFTGREVRELLELHSSDFTWERNGDSIVIDTRGWGHGVGMSQYGADGMAKEGKTYQDIVRYYYQGVEISTIDRFMSKMVVHNKLE